MCDATPLQRTYYDDLIRQWEDLYKEKSDKFLSAKNEIGDDILCEDDTSDERHGLNAIQLLTEMRKVSVRKESRRVKERKSVTPTHHFLLFSFSLSHFLSLSLLLLRLPFIHSYADASTQTRKSTSLSLSLSLSLPLSLSPFSPSSSLSLSI